MTSAGAGPSVGKHILMAYLPPEQAVVGERAGRRVHERALPGDGRRRRLDADLRSRQHPDPLVHEGPRLRQARADDRRQDRAHRRRAAIETRHLGFTISPHEECGVEEAVRHRRASTAARSTVLTLGPPEAEEQLRDAMAIGADRGDPARDRRRGLGPAGDRRGDRRGGRGPTATAST